MIHKILLFLSYNYKPNDLFYNSLIYPQEILYKFGYMAKRVNIVTVDSIDLAKEKHEDHISLIKNKQIFFDNLKKTVSNKRRIID